MSLSTPSAPVVEVDDWTTETTVRFVQISNDRIEAYWSALEWMAGQMQAQMAAAPVGRSERRMDGRQLAIADTRSIEQSHAFVG